MAEVRFDPERVARVASALAAGERNPQTALCTAAAGVVGVASAGVVLISGGRVLGSVCVSDAVSEAVEEVQFTLGEGPCIDACKTGKPVLVPDLAGRGIVRWPGFREGAQALGVRAAFGFPLLIESVSVGALNLYNDRAGALSAEQHADALVVAHLASRIVLGWQSVAGVGSLAWQLEQVPVHRAVVHQAAGMVSVQAAVSVDDALLLLRAYAFVQNEAITAVADKVLDGSLRIDDPPPPAP